MKRYLAALLSLLLLFSLVACHAGEGNEETAESQSQSDITISAETDTTENTTETEILESTSESIVETEPVTETEDTETETEPARSMDLNRYMRSLVGFFYEPCDKLEPKALRDDILSLLFSFSYQYGEELGFADWDETRADESLLIIQGEGLRKVGKMLLGDDFDARDYHDTLDWGVYIGETDTYEVSFGTDYWGGELVEIVFGTQPAITETADGAEVVAALRLDDPGDMAAADVIPDAPPVFFLRYTFKSVVSEGFCYYRLVSIAAADDLTLQATPLTAAQLQAFEDFLNDPANNGFVGENLYTSPDKIDLNAVFYDGAGIGIPSWEWDDEEKQGVLDAVGWEEYFNAAIKIPRAEADRLLQERLGLSLADFHNKISDFHYVEAYDAYYTMHGDTNLLPITVLDGEIDENGVYTVHYTSEYSSDGTFTVTLCKTEEGLRFLSNVSGDGTGAMEQAAFDIDVQPSDAEGTESPDYVHFVDETGLSPNYKITVTAKETIDSFCFIELDEAEELTVGKTLYVHSAGKPLVIHTYLNDAALNRGISYVDESGEVIYMGFFVSMRDGSVTLEEIAID